MFYHSIKIQYVQKTNMEKHSLVTKKKNAKGKKHTKKKRKKKERKEVNKQVN